jgi:hypothetical protein
LKYAGKPIPRNARSGLSGQIKDPIRKKPELQGIKNESRIGDEKNSVK